MAVASGKGEAGAAVASQHGEYQEAANSSQRGRKTVFLRCLAICSTEFASRECST